MYSKEQWEEYGKMYEELETFAYAYLKEFGNRNEDLTSVTIEGGRIELNTETYYSGCGSDYGSYTLPLSYLWTDNWIELEKEKRAEEARIKEEKRLEKEAEKQKKIEDDEKAKYLELQAKYGNGDPVER